MVVHGRVWNAAGAFVLLGAVLTGCSAGDGTGGPRTRPSGGAPARVVPVLTEAQAREVFERYVRENAAADEKGDTEAASRIEGGRLLEESRAHSRLHQARGSKDQPVRYVRPVFLIPQAPEGAPAPRGFAVLSKWEGRETDRSSVLHYFMRGGADGDWKAVAATWVVTEPAPATPSADPSRSPKPGTLKVRPKVLPPVASGASGTVELSPTAAPDTAVCGRYADYLSFTVPEGKPDSPHFERGDFTSGVVEFFNGWDEEELVRSLSFRRAGEELPVFRLKDGGSLVVCTLEGTYRDRGRTPAHWIELDAGSDSAALLGGGTRKWASLEEEWSVTAVVEVPPGGRPATVLSTDVHRPTKTSVKGVAWK
ncbi:hypothetical protein [Streptomyces sp. NPDC048603]|uniref:hypothetical protein n=1 Tax=Streptomyces sp. NPDC048603 TaxID=3365577 RepID=UPI00371F9E75